MHELSITSYLVETVQNEAQAQGATKVSSINLIAGERAGIVDDSIQFYFEQLAPGTILEGAHLNIQHTPMRFYCDGCASDYVPSGATFDCPSCGQVGQVTDDGSALLIESIEIE